jgi:hypothetical protein
MNISREESPMEQIAHEIQKHLRNKYAGEVYRAIIDLTKGNSNVLVPASELIRRLNHIKRPRIYECLNLLNDSGFIIRASIRPKIYRMPTPVEFMNKLSKILSVYYKIFNILLYGSQNIIRMNTSLLTETLVSMLEFSDVIIGSKLLINLCLRDNIFCESLKKFAENRNLYILLNEKDLDKELMEKIINIPSIISRRIRITDIPVNQLQIIVGYRMIEVVNSSFYLIPNLDDQSGIHFLISKWKEGKEFSISHESHSL